MLDVTIGGNARREMHTISKKEEIIKNTIGILNKQRYYIDNADLKLLKKKYDPIHFFQRFDKVLVLAGDHDAFLQLIENDIDYLKNTIYNILKSFDDGNLFPQEEFKIMVDYFREPYGQFYFHKDENVNNYILI